MATALERARIVTSAVERRGNPGRCWGSAPMAKHFPSPKNGRAATHLCEDLKGRPKGARN